MPGFSEQPKQTLTADTKSGEVSVADRMEALHELVKKGRKPEGEHDYVKEALRIVTAMYDGIENERPTFEPQVIELTSDEDISNPPTISADGRRFGVGIKTRTQDLDPSRHLVFSDKPEVRKKTNRGITEINSSIGKIFLINDGKNLNVYDDCGCQIFGKDNLVNHKNHCESFVTFPAGIGYFENDVGSFFYSFHDKKTRQVGKSLTAVVYGDKLLLDSINDNKKFLGGNVAVNELKINDKLVAKGYDKLVKHFEHDGQVFAIVQRNFGRVKRLYLVDETGKEKLLYWEVGKKMSLVGFLYNYNELDIEIHDFGIEIVYMNLLEKNLFKCKKRYYDFNGKNFVSGQSNEMKDRSVWGTIDGKSIFCFKSKNGHYLVDNTGKEFARQCLEHMFTDNTSHVMFNNDVYYLECDVSVKPTAVYLCSVKGKRIRIKDNSSDLDLIAKENHLYIKAKRNGMWFDEKGDPLIKGITNIYDVLIFGGQEVIVTEGIKGKYRLMYKNGSVLADGFDVMPNSIKLIKGKMFVFSDLEDKKKENVVYDCSLISNKVAIGGDIRLIEDENAFVLVKTRVMINDQLLNFWRVYDCNMEQLGEPFDEVYETRKREDGKVWILGKRKNQIVYEPAGGVDNT